jgi:hypothetical protein
MTDIRCWVVYDDGRRERGTLVDISASGEEGLIEPESGRRRYWWPMENVVDRIES